jgi:predicted ester cyclase
MSSSSRTKVNCCTSDDDDNYYDDSDNGCPYCRCTILLEPRTIHNIAGVFQSTIKSFLGLSTNLDMKSTVRNIAVVRRFVDEVFNAGDVDVLDEIAAVNWKDHTTRGREGWKKRTLALHESFPDVHMTIDDIFSVKDKVVIRYTVEATEREDHKRKGKHFRASGITIARLRNGRFQENWNYFDELSMMQQLGKIK